MRENIMVLWLSQLPGMNRKRLLPVLSYFSTLELLLGASLPELEAAGLSSAQARRVLSAKGLEAEEDRYYEWKDGGITYFSILDPLYPALLKETPDPPVGLYMRGYLPEEDCPHVAVIGSRLCSERGAWAAHRLAGELAENGVVEVGGMAAGIDAAGHAGALDKGGTTIAVLGSGVDVCYPPENRHLMDRILETGCVLSEYPLGTPAFGYNFPERNRIISGLSHGVVVVEAAAASGTQHTVTQALEAGREVMAMPGPVYDSTNLGNNRLLLEGATPVTCGADVMEALGIPVLPQQNRKIKKEETELETIEKTVYDCLDNTPTTLETILNRTTAGLPEIQYALTLLETKGLIRCLAGTRYMKIK